MTKKKFLFPINAVGIFILTSFFLSGCRPVITKLNPDHGNINSEVIIEGKYFSSTPAGNTVKFANNVTVPVTNITVLPDKNLKVIVPVGAITGQVSVKTNKGTGLSPENFKVDTNFGANWTFMVYLDADNNLESAGIDDFLEMSSVGSKNGVNIVVQMDRINGFVSTYGNWTGTKRFLINPGDTPSSTPLDDMGEQNMGDPAVLQAFVEWAVTEYPAQHYALSIWNHGDGWRKNVENMDKIVKLKKAGGNENLVKAVASDNTDGDILYMREVQDALNGARTALDARNNTSVKIDVIGFDACLMGMLEVAYALRNETNYMVGSEETEPGPGWPYNTILTELTNSPTMPASNLAKIIVQKYGDSYSYGVTQAAYDMSKINDLTLKLDLFSAVATSEWPALKTARDNTKDFHSCSYSCWGTDLWDFADQVYTNVTATNIKNAADAIKTSIDNFVIAEFHNTDMAGSHGVAVYFPPDKSSYTNDPQHTGYEETNTFMPVDFVNQHQYDNWLQKYLSNNP